jgi:hypothetical protein
MSKRRFLVLEEKKTTLETFIKGKTCHKSELVLVRVVKADSYPTTIRDKYLSDGRNVSIVEIPKKGKCHIVLSKSEIIK